MRRELDFFDEQVLVLLHIAKKLKESLRVESLLDEAGVDYHIEVDNYMGGVIFRSARAGAFFYVLQPARDSAVAVLQRGGIRLALED